MICYRRVQALPPCHGNHGAGYLGIPPGSIKCNYQALGSAKNTYALLPSLSTAQSAENFPAP